MLIKEYFQEIESQIVGNPHVSESHILKDTRSLHIGIIEGEVSFIDESALHFIELSMLKRQRACINIHITIRTRRRD